MLIKSFDKLGTNGNLLIPFVVSKVSALRAHGVYKKQTLFAAIFNVLVSL
jgi:hypothetical protein